MFVTEIPFLSVVLRLTFAAIAGGLVGLERETHGQPAGLRTHMLVSIGSCIAMLVSVYMITFGQFADPGRIAAQVISGIGFLGAGAIIRYGPTVRGITTAAGIWATAGIGLAMGAGLYSLGSFAVFLSLIILYVLDLLEKRFIAEQLLKTITITLEKEEPEIGTIENVLKSYGLNIKKVSLHTLIDNKHTEVTMYVKGPELVDVEELTGELRKLDDVTEIEID